MRTLSKSKLLAYRQCAKRLWLEIHRPELRADSESTQTSFEVGHQVGEIARDLYDPDGTGVLIDVQSSGFDAAFSKSQTLLTTPQPIFEAGFQAEGALAFADVMLPVTSDQNSGWRMVEVKSSTSVKDYHRDDAAIQSFIAKSAGVPLFGIALAHIDSQWVYPGGGDYRGLLVEEDLTDEAFSRGAEVGAWIAEAQAVVQEPNEPNIQTGKHCEAPYECGFLGHCQSQEPTTEYPVTWLPRIQSKDLRTLIDTRAARDLRDVPDSLLNESQLRVKQVTLSGEPYFDAAGAARALNAHTLPAWFMDFETIQFAVPIWKSTRPYQQIPFQFSVHRLETDNTLAHKSFLDISGDDPSEAFAQALIAACEGEGPIFVYNAGFETARINELAKRFPSFADALQALNARVVDLLPIARDYYYHPSQQGSWSIKAVLPALCPDLSYGNLDGVQDGGMAMDAFLEALAPETSAQRKAEIQEQLLAYCALDTFAMVRLWAVFSGRTPAV